MYLSYLSSGFNKEDGKFTYNLGKKIYAVSNCQKFMITYDIYIFLYKRIKSGCAKIE